MPLKCNRRNMTEFAETLESGRYRQGRHTLRRDDGTYCCLGVACDISQLGHWMKPEPAHNEMNEGWTYVTMNGFASGTMPKAVIDWLGLESENDYHRDLDALPLSPSEVNDNGDSYQYATSLNDTGETFAQIAQRIRETYLTED